MSHKFCECNRLFLELMSICELIEYEVCMLDVIIEQFDSGDSSSPDIDRRMDVLLQSYRSLLESAIDRIHGVKYSYRKLSDANDMTSK